MLPETTTRILSLQNFSNPLRYFSARENNAAISPFGRFQFSVEKTYRLRYFTPLSTA
ncbi:unknown [Corallococcus sp. CAG:1435]|nr:unknown [Corallococcus sp. CAG:1435]